MMEILQTPTFAKQAKKLHQNQKKALDKAITAIAENPQLGDQKKGDLSDVLVYKFKMVNQLTLLAYELRNEQLQLILLTFGPHENFYRDLKN
jgi:mRNA-degrading endonuclease RelE of RelBE toxin-antitoxin system